MSIHTHATSVHRSIVVHVPIEQAFTVFTEGIGSWWRQDQHLIPGPVEMEFQPYAGGHIIDRGADGSECRWARVLEYEPPSRVVFSWDISPRWEIETDPARTSEVVVAFSEQESGSTLVELEHRHLDRHGDGWQGMREAVDSPNGWSLAPFAAAVDRA